MSFLKKLKLQSELTYDGHRILNKDKYCADVYGSHAGELTALFAAAPELLIALERAYSQIIELLNDGKFERDINFDAGYILDAIAKATVE